MWCVKVPHGQHIKKNTYVLRVETLVHPQYHLARLIYCGYCSAILDANKCDSFCAQLLYGCNL